MEECSSKCFIHTRQEVYSRFRIQKSTESVSQVSRTAFIYRTVLQGFPLPHKYSPIQVCQQLPVYKSALNQSLSDTFQKISY